jgi:hypothetical protein
MKRLILFLAAIACFAQAPLPSPVNASSGGGGGGGTTCSGTAGQILVSNGTSTCVGATPTISGSTITATLSGNSSTATALAANPTDCGANEFANAIAANGNLTCAVPSGGAGDAATVVAVTYGATPTFTADSNTATLFTMTLTGNVSSCTIAGATAGQVLTLRFTQDGTGTRTVACTGFGGLGTVDTTAAAVCTQPFQATSSSAAVATGPMVCSGTAAIVIPGSTSGATTIVAPATGGGTATFFSGSDTVVGKATTDTFTNKTLNCNGTGNVCSNIDLSADVTGTLPVANGGTGITSFGTGVATALGTNVSGSGAICLATGSACAGSTYNPTDMTTEIYNDWSIVSDYPAAMGTYNGASVCNGSGGIAASGQDPAGVQLQSEASTNNYCQVFYNSKTGATTARFPDYVSSSNFRAFSFAMRLNPTSTADVRIRFGAFASVTADPQGVYLEYDSSVGSTWYCVVNDGSATSTNTTVTATTSRATLSISASATGTLSCAVDGSTPVTAVDTFPASTFWGWQIKTLTNANKAFQANSPKIAFTGLTR